MLPGDLPSTHPKSISPVVNPRNCLSLSLKRFFPSLFYLILKSYPIASYTTFLGLFTLLRFFYLIYPPVLVGVSLGILVPLLYILHTADLPTLLYLPVTFIFADGTAIPTSLVEPMKANQAFPLHLNVLELSLQQK